MKHKYFLKTYAGAKMKNKIISITSMLMLSAGLTMLLLQILPAYMQQNFEGSAYKKADVLYVNDPIACHDLHNSG